MTTVRLPADITLAMARLQARDGIPASEQMRRALRDFLVAKKVYKRKGDVTADDITRR